MNTISPGITGQALRLARIAVRFGRMPRGQGEFRPGLLGRLGRFASEFLVRHRAWERRFVSEQLRRWRKTRSIRCVGRLRRGLNIQMHDRELDHILSVLEVKRPCAMLVFGMGNDSILWFEANRGGQTLFVEDDGYWDRVIRERHPSLRSIRVLYGTRAADWRDDIGRAPALLLPAPVGNQCWDIVLVDGPAAYKADKPGRVQSVHAARRLVAQNGAILVHDCDREAERAICGSVLGHMALAGQVHSLRHYIRRPEAPRMAEATTRDGAGSRDAGAWPAAAFDGLTSDPRP
ncbi:MAG: hypothetical protein AB7O49_10375 [Sphingomonadales bacterium]